MDATYKKEIGGVTHFYCDHHKVEDSIKILHVVQKTELQKLLPLLSIFGVITLLTVGTTYFQIDFSGMNIMMLFMAYFFLIFGLFKVVNLKNFAEAYATYDVLAMKSKTYAYLYPFIEIGLGVLYFLYLGGVYRDVFTFIIMSIGTYGVWKALQDKDEIPCACLGMVFNVPMTKVTLFENLLMALMALYMVLAYVQMGNMAV
jgi:hypothetical protein